MSEFNPDQVMEAVKGVREIADKVQGDLKKLDGYDQEKFEKMNEFLDKQEEASQKMTLELEESKKREEENLERVKALETEMARKISTGEKSNYRETDEYKALAGWIKKSDDFFQGDNAELKALMRTDDDTAGGYLVMGEMDNEITKKITEISPVRAFARVRTISAKSLEVPVRDRLLEAEYEGEAETAQDDASSYNAETITPYRLSVNVPITMDLLMDSSFDMEAEILGDAAEAFAFKEGNKFILGDGVKQPQGILGDPRVTGASLESENNSTITADDFILLQGELKTGYNGAFMLNRRTLAVLRTQKSTDGVYLWLPGLNGQVANSIAGDPYALANDMPDIANGSFPVAYGDFRRGYTITDRTGVSVIRDEVTQKRRAIIEYCVKRWNTGRVVLPEAIKVLEVKTP